MEFVSDLHYVKMRSWFFHIQRAVKVLDSCQSFSCLISSPFWGVALSEVSLFISYFSDSISPCQRDKCRSVAVPRRTPFSSTSLRCSLCWSTSHFSPCTCDAHWKPWRPTSSSSSWWQYTTSPCQLPWYYACRWDVPSPLCHFFQFLAKHLLKL